jgi:hypothetical protein
MAGNLDNTPDMLFGHCSGVMHDLEATRWLFVLWVNLLRKMVLVPSLIRIMSNSLPVDFSNTARNILLLRMPFRN